jgi:membrane protein YqaA with SNARE-associated domain
MSGWRQALIAWGPWGLLVVSFIESAIPSPGFTDALLLVVSMARPDSWIMGAAVAAAGSLAGSAVFYELVRRTSEKFLHRQMTSSRGARARAWFERYGLAVVFVSALIPLPLSPMKVIAGFACALGVKRRSFLMTIFAARVPRYGAMAYLGSRLGDNAGPWLTQHVWHMSLLAAGLLLGLWALLRFADKARIAPNAT